MRSLLLILLSGASAAAFGALGAAGCADETAPGPAGPAQPVEAGGCTPPVATEGDDPCTAPLAPGTDRKCTFEFEGKKRSFLVYSPANYDACSPAPVVVDAHGATETAEQHAGLEAFKTWPNGLGSGWRIVADREGFIVVTPQGVGNFWNEGDVDFIVEVEKKVTQIANVDPKKVYFTGISNGGFLSYWTACRDLGIFQGFSPISGQAGTTTCPTTHPAPMIAFHAEGDTVIPYAGGQEGAALWAKANHCKTGPTRSMTFGGANADDRELCLASEADDKPPWRLAPCSKTAPESTCETWEGCDEGNKVTFCTVAGKEQPVGGHILYFNDTRLSLAAVAWDFFKQQQQP
jgi:poly(3-hydroxybutyrate) depolymerase